MNIPPNDLTGSQLAFVTMLSQLPTSVPKCWNMYPRLALSHQDRSTPLPRPVPTWDVTAYAPNSLN